ncbi:complement C1s subcomponent-like [Diachasmimorpha longicaudata]|uniref:complement C1s subcomponent-like n=1 Tax=Diachasmimorpha longicaudata TaxID=58733 RepID=UPI0030B8B363
MLPITPTSMFFAKFNTISLIYICFIFYDAKDVEARRQARMINGEDALIEEFPSNVFILTVYKLNGTMNTDFCSGSLITPTHVLTAAHCTVFYKKTFMAFPYYWLPQNIFVRAGVATVFLRGNDYTVKRIYRHERWNVQKELTPSSSNDIAILELNKVVELGPTQQIIKLPCTSPEFDAEGILLGAGPTSSDPNTLGTMKKATFKVVPCTNWFQFNRICVRSETVNSTPGDSGSAFIFKDRLAGIISSKPKKRDYLILTDVFTYFNWIVNIVGMPEEFADQPWMSECQVGLQGYRIGSRT